jgi:hypothetical protein
MLRERCWIAGRLCGRWLAILRLCVSLTASKLSKEICVILLR